MKFPKLVLAMVGLTMVSAAEAGAGDIKLIANSSVTASTISVRELKSVFLGEKNSLGGDHVQPVFEKSGPAHEAFLKDYLGKSDDELEKYYLALVFSGRGSKPKSVGSDAEVVAYVATNRGAIGYVSADANVGGLLTLAIVDDVHPAERKLITHIAPKYPEELKTRSIGGTVRLKLTISAKGNVENAELLGGNPVLGAAAMAAVAKWKYAAAASRTTVEVSIPFDPN